MNKSCLDLRGKWLYIDGHNDRGVESFDSSQKKGLAQDFSRAKLKHDRGVEQLEARRAHNPKVAGSSPAPATG